MITVHKLRKNNWKVRVIHNRLMLPFQGKDTVVTPEHVSAKGGKTIVELTPPGSNTTFRGEAHVHPDENYNRRLGVQIALGRALKISGIKVN